MLDGMIRLFRKLRWRIEASLALGIACLLVKWFPYKTWRWTLGDIAQPAQDTNNASERDKQIADITGRWVRRMARKAPFQAVCLPQAMAGLWILKWRGIKGQIVFAAGREISSPETYYHAWLMFGDETLTGQDTQGEFRPFQQISSR